MDKKTASNEAEKQRKQMIEFIIKSLQELDDDKLRGIYHLVLHIK